MWIHPRDDTATDSFYLAHIINLIVASEICARTSFSHRVLEEERYAKCVDASNFHGKHFQPLFRGVILTLRDVLARWSCMRNAARENANEITRFISQ